MALPPPLREVEVDSARKVAGEVLFRNGQRLRDCRMSVSMALFWLALSCSLFFVVRDGEIYGKEKANWVGAGFLSLAASRSVELELGRMRVRATFCCCGVSDLLRSGNAASAQLPLCDDPGDPNPDNNSDTTQCKVQSGSKRIGNHPMRHAIPVPSTTYIVYCTHT